MEAFKLKVTIGDAAIELEGEGELVHTIFQELKENGLGKLASSTNSCSPNTNALDDKNETLGTAHEPFSPKDLKNHSTSQDVAFPTLENVVLQGTPQKESDWLLIYSVYCSKQGTTLFTKEDLRTKYNETNRMTEARRKNFITNVKSLASDGCISAVNDNEFRLESAGLAKAKSILFGSTDDKKGRRNNSSSKKKSMAIYNILELDLSEEQRTSFRNFWNKHKHSNNMDKAVLVAYWLKKEKNIDEFTSDHLFTMLRTTEESTSFDLAAAIRNAKNQKSYFTLDSASGAYKLYHLGEDHVKTLEIVEEANK